MHVCTPRETHLFVRFDFSFVTDLSHENRCVYTFSYEILLTSNRSSNLNATFTILLTAFSLRTTSGEETENERNFHKIETGKRISRQVSVRLLGNCNNGAKQQSRISHVDFVELDKRLRRHQH